MKKLEQTQSIMQRLFDPKIKGYNTYVDTTHKKQVRQSLPLSVKKMYYQYYLAQHWEEICGSNLARQCAVEGLNDDVLTIRTSSSLFANELFMLKKDFLRKLNKFLAGELVIKELKFYTGKLPARTSPLTKKEQEQEKLSIVTCPLCQARMTSEKTICSVCERQQRAARRSKVVDLLKCQPWLDYKKCQALLPCDSFTFNSAKESLQNYYFELVRLGYAKEADSYMAVMLLTGKSVDELTESLIKNSLEYLRRNQDVSASRI